MAKKRLALLLILLVTGGVIWFLVSEPVERVIDGDTLVLKTEERVRLLAIDAPERGELGFGLAKNMLTALVWLGWQRVHVARYGKDKYGRTLAWVYGPFLPSLNRLVFPRRKAD